VKSNEDCGVDLSISGRAPCTIEHGPRVLWVKDVKHRLISSVIAPALSWTITHLEIELTVNTGTVSETDANG